MQNELNDQELASYVTSAIGAIGTVSGTSANGTAITTAETWYAKLSSNGLSKVSSANKTTLAKSRKAYDAIAAINGMSAPSYNTDYTSVANAISAADTASAWSVTSGKDNYIGNYNNKITERDRLAAVNATIAALPAKANVTFDNKSAIESARADYNALSTLYGYTNTSTTVGNYSRLTDAETKITSLATAEANRINELIADVNNFTANDDSKITAAENATNSSVNTNMNFTEVTSRLTSGYASTISTARGNYNAINPVYNKITAIGTVMYQEAANTMAFNGYGVTVTCNNTATTAEVGKGYSLFSDGAHGDYHNADSILIFRVRFRAHDDDPVWGMSINGYTIGYDFVNSRFGIMSNGMLATDTVFNPDIATSKDFTLNSNRFYDIKFDISSTHLALYVDDECLIYTTAAKRSGADYLIHYPRHVTVDYAMIDWTCGGTHVLTNATGDDLVGNTGIWKSRGAFYSSTKQTFSNAVIAKDSKAAIDEARDAYDALTDARKSLLSSYIGTLNTAENTTYPNLVSARATINSKIIDAVTAIEGITPYSLANPPTSRISTAQGKYNYVNTNYSAYAADVWNYSAIAAATAGYNTLVTDEANTIKSALDPIYPLSDLTVNSGADVTAAEAAIARDGYGNTDVATNVNTAYSNPNPSTLVDNARAIYDAIKNVYDLIMALPANAADVTRSHQSAIEGARAAYDALASHAQGDLRSYLSGVYDRLTADEAALAALLAAPTKEQMEAAITGFVFDPSSDAGIAALEEYIGSAHWDEVSSEIKAQLTAIRDNYTAVHPVYTALSGLGDTLSNSYKAVKATYDALTDARKAMISSELSAKLDLIPKIYMSGAPDSSKVKANVYFEVKNGMDLSKFTVTVGGTTRTLDSFVTAEKAVVNSGKTCYILSFTVPASQMNSPVTYSITYDDEAYTSYIDAEHIPTTNVITYCREIIGGEYTEKDKLIAQKMINYANAAEINFKASHTSSITTGVTETIVSSATIAAANTTPFDGAGLKTRMNGAGYPVSYSAMSVTFLSDTTLSIAFFKHSDCTKTDEQIIAWMNTHITLGGAAVSAVKSGNHFIISKQNVYISNINTPMALVITDPNNSEVTYNYSVSVLDYIVKAQNTGNDNLINLTKALYEYAVAVN